MPRTPGGGGPAVARGTHVPGPPVETEVARDLARQALLTAPVLLLLSAVGWGVDGVLSSAFALMLVTANFAASAALLANAGRFSLPVLAGAAMLGFPVRLGLVALAALAVRDQPWVAVVPLGLTLLVAHLGLLIWEVRRLSLSLAFPGLKPGRKVTG